MAEEYHDRWLDGLNPDRMNDNKAYVSTEFKLSESIQEQVLAHLLQDASGLRKYVEIISPRYFSNTTHAEIANYLVRFYEEYGAAPSRVEFLEYVRIYRERYEMFRSGIDTYLDMIDRLYSLRYNAAFLDDQCIRFAQSQAMYNVIVEMIGDVVNGRSENYDDHIRKMTLAAHIGDNSDDTWYDMKRGWRERRKALKETGGEVEPHYKTGLGDILDETLNGGLCRKELELVIAATGRGKSVAMHNIGASMSRQGLDVFHVSLENKKNLAENLYAALLAGISVDEVSEDVADEIMEAVMEQIDSGAYGNITVTDPDDEYSVMSLRSDLERYHMRNGKYPDVVIVDYLALMKPLRTHKDSQYLEEIEIAKDLKKLAKKYNLIMITAQQTNRTGEGKDVVDLTSISGAYGVPAQTDNTFAIGATDAEKNQGIAHLFNPKARNAKSHILFNGTIDWEGARKFNFFEIGERRVDEDGNRVFRKNKKTVTDQNW